MTQRYSRDELAARMIRAGVFHGPGGIEMTWTVSWRTSGRYARPSTTQIAELQLALAAIGQKIADYRVAATA